jgi:pimeloyl-ACP methyl ester carboxylesterase
MSETSPRPDHFIVLVPGFMGSTLRSKRTGRMVWGNFDQSLKEATRGNPFGWIGWIRDFLNGMRYPNPDLEAVDLMEEVAFFPPLYKQEHYQRLSAFLKTLGYKVGDNVPESQRNVYEFPYDWRQDNRTSGRQLKAKIKQWRAHHPNAEVWIIAHSNGGLVARWYIEKEAGKKIVTKLFLMGSPWDGTAVGFKSLSEGVEMFLRGSFTQKTIQNMTRDIIQTFPSAYQLLPHEWKALRFSANESDIIFNHPNWLGSDATRNLLKDARKFNEELGNKSSIPTFCYVGRGFATVAGSEVQRGNDGKWLGLKWQSTGEGDGTITVRSASHPTAKEVITVPAAHSDIYIDPTVEAHLKWEMSEQYEPGARATLETPTMSILFVPGKNLYAPDELMTVIAEIRGETGEAISDAQNKVTLRWLQALPGDESSAHPPATQTFVLHPDVSQSGRYVAVLNAPTIEGYYELKGEFVVPNQPPALLSEVVLVETVTMGLWDETLLTE